jgi:hypothetical protein
VTVTEPFSVFARCPELECTRGEYEKQANGYAEQTLAAVADTANSAGVSCETVHVEREHVYEAIIDTATAHEC